MDKKLPGGSSPFFWLYFAALFAFVGVTCWLKAWWAAAIELVLALVLLALFFRWRRRRHVAPIISGYEPSAAGSGVVGGDLADGIPMPIVFIRVMSGELLWCNKSFAELTGCPKQYSDVSITDLIDGFDLRWILEGKPQHPELLVINNRCFDIRASFARPSAADKTLCAALYWIEVTSEMALRQSLDESRQVVGELICDNYDELGKSGSEATRTSMLAMLDTRLAEWSGGINCTVRKTDRDKYFLYTDEKSYRVLADRRFDILEKARQITAPNGMPLTLSIGIGRGADGLAELVRLARLALDMAVSRGGDQTVVKTPANFEFFGGTTKEIEKNGTKIKSRMMASVLKGLIADSSTVYVMGHRIADIDSLGGAAGVVCAARKLGKKAFIVLDRGYNNAETLVELLESNPAYAGVIVTGETALLEMDSRSLLVVVDTNRASYVEDSSLLESFNRIAVVDHHRRVADYISNAVLSVHEPAASSVCELICELLQYIVEPGDILRTEATAMLAGIVLDTKSFSLKTGSRTFEAAAYLRRSGADSFEVKRLFQNDLDNYVKRAELVKRAEFIDDSYAVSISDKPVDRAIAAQAADDLMNITGVAGSFVLFPFEDTISISARSLGRINMQLIMEKLGGGGHYTTAGAQLKGKTMQEARSMLKDAITLYNYENNR